MRFRTYTSIPALPWRKDSGKRILFLFRCFWKERPIGPLFLRRYANCNSFQNMDPSRMRIFFWLPVLLWSCTPQTPASDATATPTAVATTPAATAPEPAVTAPVTAVESDWLIVPGQRIGETALGDDPQTLITRLGRPDASDAAMGKAWLVWNGHRQGNTLAVFTAYADTSMRRKAGRFGSQLPGFRPPPAFTPAQNFRKSDRPFPICNKPRTRLRTRLYAMTIQPGVSLLK